MVAQAKTVEPTVVNGVNVDDLMTLIAGVKRDARGRQQLLVDFARPLVECLGYMNCDLRPCGADPWRDARC